jgi:NADH-quinone oxidoreductase subunit A|tara:strand:+ start:119 stop:487 length:369 start_codon:yes stop_codon:yes gene_type:complete
LGTETLSLVVIFILAISIPIAFMILSSLFGPKRPNKDKLEAYECGIDSQTDTQKRFPVKFYLVAVFFILFDIEVAFLYPWAVNFKTLTLELGVMPFMCMLAFIVILGVGLLYIIRKGALRWD